jgi:ubiquinone/menaquinone biosynthesis C-methylase UbiE
MRVDIVRYLRNPKTKSALELDLALDNGNIQREWLVDLSTGDQIPVQDDIPVFASEDQIMGSNRKYQRLYDLIARGYDLSEKLVGDVFWGGRDAIRREILKEIRVEAGMRVLEVAIGTGVNLRYLTSNADYWGLDISMGMLRQCQRNLKLWKREAVLIQGMAEMLPFVDGLFDIVFHFGGINFFNDQSAAMHEMMRVAKPGAKIFVGDETEALAKQAAASPLPFAKEFYGERSQQIEAPLRLVPEHALEPASKMLCDGKFYMVSFQKPHDTPETHDVELAHPLPRL